MKKYEEEAQRLGVPIVPPLPPQHGRQERSNPVVAICGECGLHIHQVMGYCCSNNRCPVTINVRPFIFGGS